MITVIVLTTGGKISQFVCNDNSLFELLYILDFSNKVIVFKVAKDANAITNTHYGWGKFNKWVLEFDNNDYKL